MNSIFVIHPYLDKGGVLVFDDPAHGLLVEAFVAGADLIILGAAVRAGIKDKSSFTLIFSETEFPGYQAKAVRTGKGDGGSGDWYSVNDAQGWLCPALLKYFPVPPSNIYFAVKEKSRDAEMKASEHAYEARNNSAWDAASNYGGHP